MPVIIFVVTVVMLLSMMGYARIDQYRTFSTMKSHFEKYMTTLEREYYSLRSIKWYNDTTVTSKNQPKGDGQNKSKATARLSLYPLFDKQIPQAEFERFEQHRLALRQLIDLLYGQTALCRKVIAQRPQFIDELIAAMIAANAKLPDDQKVTQPKDLANLDLGDPIMNEIFYKVLKGCKRANSIKDAIAAIPKKVDSADLEDNPVDDGYVSLLDFINVDKKSKLRVYLAARPLLLAISGNPALVTEILASRKDLYGKISSDPPQLSVEEASKQFEDLFSGRISSIFNGTLLDYSVSKTDPSTYD